MIKNAQVNGLFKFLLKGKPLYISAQKAGICENTARKYIRVRPFLNDKFPARTWRTHTDAFSEVWPQIETILLKEPSFRAKSAFKLLQREYPGRFSINQLRTFQRRVTNWKSLNDKNNNYQRETAIKQEKTMSFLILGETKKFPYSHSLDLNEDDYYKLIAIVNSQKKSSRIKAISIIARSLGIYMSVIHKTLRINNKTLKSYIGKFKRGGFQRLFTRLSNRMVKAINPYFCNSVFEILHSPPISHNINRTSWRLTDIKQIMDKQGKSISVINIRQIIRNAGFRIRKAQKVLTSNDPKYEEKLLELTTILSNLKCTESFFSIDEFGPLSICIKGGNDYVRGGEKKIIPQWQKSKGKLIVTAALELSSNQITHFYSERKNTFEMIRLLEILVSQYATKEKIYFSWDAASWHASKELYRKVEQINSVEFRSKNHCPFIQLVPLPSSAQFLNVIESVFSGMARAIIHNSDYISCDECKIAIDRYFTERNDHFRQNPARAGKKIWGKELTAANFELHNNCKDPQWR